MLGHSWAYWTLLGAGVVANYCSGRYWSFARGGSHPGVRVAIILGAVAAAVAAAAMFLDAFIVIVSLFMVLVTMTTLAFQLYKWWRPEHHSGGVDEPRCPV